MPVFLFFVFLFFPCSPRHYYFLCVFRSICVAVASRGAHSKYQLSDELLYCGCPFHTEGETSADTQNADQYAQQRRSSLGICLDLLAQLLVRPGNADEPCSIDCMFGPLVRIIHLNSIYYQGSWCIRVNGWTISLISTLMWEITSTEIQWTFVVKSFKSYRGQE